MEALRNRVGAALHERVLRLRPLSGGDINQAFCAELEGGTQVFVKTHDAPPAAMYTREAAGLSFLAEANALRVPRVLACNDELLVLEWIGSRTRASEFDELFGRGLAQLHRTAAPSFGLAEDNYIGSLAQPNQSRPDWPTFYAEQRLWPLARRAHAAGHLQSAMLTRLEQLCTRLPTLCGPTEPPSRLHGDLWSGNIMSDENGHPTLIDPAVYGGHREIDLAMLMLFGTPSMRLLAAYEEVYPRAEGASERVALYQLYPLLVHIALFGASYVSAFSRALSRYV